MEKRFEERKLRLREGPIKLCVLGRLPLRSQIISRSVSVINVAVVDATRSQRSILLVPFVLVYVYIVPAFIMDHAV